MIDSLGPMHVHSSLCRYGLGNPNFGTPKEASAVGRTNNASSYAPLTFGACSESAGHVRDSIAQVNAHNPFSSGSRLGGSRLSVIG